MKTGLETLSFKKFADETIMDDGKKIIRWGADQKFIVQELLPNRESQLMNYFNNSHEYRMPTIDHNGKRIAYLTPDDFIEVMETETGRILNHFETRLEGSIADLAITSDGSRILGKYHQFKQKIWDQKSGKALTKVGGFDRVIGFVDNEKIIGTYPDDSIRIVNFQSGKEISRIGMPGEKIRIVEISQDGNKILGQTDDKKNKVWDTKTGKEIFKIEDEMRLVSFNSISSHIVGILEDELSVWDIESGKKTFSTAIDDELVDYELYPIFFSEGNKILAMTDLKTFKVFDIRSGKEQLAIHVDFDVSHFSVSSDGSRIIGSNRHGVLKVWDAETGRVIAKSSVNDDGIGSLLITPNGKKIVVVGHDQSLAVYDTENLAEIWKIKTNDKNEISPVLSRDGKKLIGTIDGKTARIWDLENGKESSFFEGFSNGISANIFSPDGRYILSDGFDEQIIVWDIKTGNELQMRNEDFLEIHPPLNAKNNHEKLWSVEIDETKLFLINNKNRNERIARDRELLAKWAKPDSTWHLTNAKDSEDKKDWFAAKFHYQKLLEIDPENKEYKFKLTLAKLEPKPEEYFKNCQLVSAQIYDKPILFDEKINEMVKLESIFIPSGKIKSNQKSLEIQKPFYMGKYEVTQEQWEAIMGNNPSGQKGPKLPVTNVSWYDCQEFIKKLNQKTNSKYRLPTGNEWEYACRAGTTTDFAFGDKLLPEHANFKESNLGKYVDVGSYKPNNFGLYDMHGNAFEWVSDITAKQQNKSAKTPEDPKEIFFHGIRGGYYVDPPNFIRSSNQNHGLENVIYQGSGFRVLKEID